MPSQVILVTTPDTDSLPELSSDYTPNVNAGDTRKVLRDFSISNPPNSGYTVTLHIVTRILDAKGVEHDIDPYTVVVPMIPEVLQEHLYDVDLPNGSIVGKVMAGVAFQETMRHVVDLFVTVDMLHEENKALGVVVETPDPEPEPASETA